MNKTVSGDGGKNTILACNNLWKVFGVDAATFARHGMQLSAEEMADRGWVPAVRDVSLDIDRGEVFVIMGLSGSGKSTLVRLLSRLVEPTTGSVKLDGSDLMELSDRELMNLRKSKMGMVFQHFALLPNRTVLGNISFPLQIRGASRQECETRALALVELVGLQGRENNFPAELSGGQQQRVGIARSLAGNPELWFLDEPFSALDPLIRNDLQDELMRLQSKLAKTIVFITHDLDEAIKLADRIAIMDHGKIAQVGSPEQLVLAPANDYVRRFTSKVHLAKVVKVGTITNRSKQPVSSSLIVDSTQTVEQVALQSIGYDGPIVVRDSHGLIGHVEREQLFRILAGAAHD